MGMHTAVQVCSLGRTSYISLNNRILIENLLAGKAGWKYNLSIYLLANVIFVSEFSM
jgi:hypothetical protein